MMWNRRMLQASGEARFADIMELNWFNSIQSGVEVRGIGWSYANPIRWHAADHEVIHETKYAHKRSFPGRSLICCPTNVLRNLAMYPGYLYGASARTVWVHHYAGSGVEVQLPGGPGVKLDVRTKYPWDGVVRLTLGTGGSYVVKLRIPYWAGGSTVKVNGRKFAASVIAGEYASLSNDWQPGDVVELDMPMDVKLLVSDYLMESSRAQVAVKRGPVVYCLESCDIPAGVAIEDVVIPSDSEWAAEFRDGLLGGVTVLKTTALAAAAEGNRIGGYRELGDVEPRKVGIEMIPYFAWNNREESKMSVWLPASIR
jgi:DUF1680 family protein